MPDYDKPGSLWTDADWKDALSHPQPPDDPDEKAEFEFWTYFEKGRRVTVKRKNPNYKPPR